MYKVGIITLSDRASAGVYEDKSGAYLQTVFNNDNFEVQEYFLIVDDQSILKEKIEILKDKVDLIITSGGTGLSSKDITVEVVENLIDYEIRGMSIALHQFSLTKSMGAMFSRALCGVIQQTMIITMPGSLKAVTELSELFLPHLKHGLDHLHNKNVH